MVASAWLYSVPYQGTPLPLDTNPRISRHSSVPTAATTTAAVGPPSAAAAKIGAVPTLTIAPPGIRTGTAELTATSTVQNATPCQPPIVGPSGTVTRTMQLITTAVATTAAMSTLSLAGNS